MKHKEYDAVLNLTGRGNNIPVLLTGEAGLGKSTIVEQIAEELGLSYSYIAGSGQTSESKLLGYTDATGNTVETLFTLAYKNGGVFCLEEMDAIPSSVLVALNTAIVSNQGSFAGKMYKRHKDFYMFATTNTYNGVTEKYSGRNKLDDSTLERYYKVDITLDLDIERQLMTAQEADMLSYFRSKLDDYSITISTRQALMFIGLKGLPLKKALLMTIFRKNKDVFDILESEFISLVERSDLKTITQKEIDNEKISTSTE